MKFVIAIAAALVLFCGVSAEDKKPAPTCPKNCPCVNSKTVTTTVVKEKAAKKHKKKHQHKKCS